MEKKKNQNADIEKNKSVFFQIGLIAAMGLVLLAFEWTTVKLTSKEIPGDPIDIYNYNDELPPVILQKEELPEPPKPQVKKVNVSLPPEVVDDTKVIDSNEPAPEPTDKKDNQVDVSHQPDVIVEPTVFIVVEDMPSFPGGEEERLKYLQNNLKVPAIVKDARVNGTAHIGFIIDEEGNVTEVKLLKGVNPHFDKEALRVVNQMPKWIPGRQRGKEVKVQMSMPITLKVK